MSLILPSRRIVTPALERALSRPPMRRQEQPQWDQLPQQQQRFFQGGCACCPTCDPCTHCDPAPSQYTMEAVGLTNGFCANCESAYGGVQTLTNDCLAGAYSLDPCTWSTPYSEDAAPCIPGCSLCSRWRLFVGGVTVELECDATGMAVYSLAKAAWDCTGSNVMVQGSASLHCDNWPATITVNPV